MGIELNKIYNEDCLETMRRMPDNFVDCVITSPPYNKNGFRGKKDSSKGKGRWNNANITYSNFSDDMNEKDYQDWQVNIINESIRILKPNGSIFYNHKIRRSNNRASHPYEWIIKSKAIFYQQIIWDRSMSIDHNINYLAPTTEIIFWLTKDKPKVIKDSNFLYDKEIWKINPLPDKNHPAPFPVKLAKIICNLVTEKNDIVYDPFMGSGTTARASYELGRNYIGSEISKKYCDLAEDRLKQGVLL